MKIPNPLARRIAISSSGLPNNPSVKCNKRDLLGLIKRLGYVQQDPIQVVARAHDHIIWSRNNGYRPGQIDALLQNDHSVFEHFCHDACVLPLDTLPYWVIQFKRKAKLKQFKGAGSLLSKAGQRDLLDRFSNEGPLCSRDFKIPKSELKKVRATWSKPLHKKTLDYLWLSGVLAVSKRDKFIKYYDLAERIFPQSVADIKTSDSECIDWLANQAIDRLGFGSLSEIKAFWDAFTLDETKQWRKKHSKIVDVLIETAEGEYKNSLSRNPTGARKSSAYPLSKRMRILNPFDPLIRDRKRLLYLFGFDYRIEMYVPPSLRQYGYYVYPLLEYDTFVGRIEVRHDRQRNVLCVDNLWAEANVSLGKQRMGKLHSELERMKRFCGADCVQWSN